MRDGIIKQKYIKEFKSLKYWNISYFAPKILRKGTLEDNINLNTEKEKTIDINMNFNFERPYNEGIEWKLKKEMEVLKLFKEYRIIPKSCDKEPISDDDWIDAFANIRLLHSLVEEKDNPLMIFCVRINTMILKDELKNKEETKKILSRLKSEVF